MTWRERINLTCPPLVLSSGRLARFRDAAGESLLLSADAAVVDVAVAPAAAADVLVAADALALPWTPDKKQTGLRLYLKYGCIRSTRCMHVLRNLLSRGRCESSRRYALHGFLHSRSCRCESLRSHAGSLHPHPRRRPERATPPRLAIKHTSYTTILVGPHQHGTRHTAPHRPGRSRFEVWFWEKNPGVL